MRREAESVLRKPSDIPIVFHDSDHIPERRGYSKNPGAGQFEKHRQVIARLCRRFGPAYGVMDDQWGEETRYIHVETSEITRKWVDAIVRKLQQLQRWAVGMPVPEGYVMIFADAVHVCGPAFREAQSLDEVIARAQHRLRLDQLLDQCSTDQDLEELVRTRELKNKPIRILGLSDVTDAGLRFLTGLPRIQTLVLCGKITNGGLPSLGPLTELKDLTLSGDSRVTDLATLPVMPVMQSLSLDRSRITDDGLASLKKQPVLEELSLDGTKVTARGILHLARVSELKKLSLRYCRIGDEALKVLKRIRSLRCLDLRGTRITDGGAVLLRGFPNLRELDLSGTRLTSRSLPHLAKLHRLEELTLFESRLSAEEIEGLRLALPVCSVFSP
jgi:hypothetical protein